MIRVQPARQYQLRRACDRCHKSKLRCLRDDEDGPCQRCQQAGTDCFSSPASRPQRQKSIKQIIPPSRRPSQNDDASSQRSAASSGGYRGPFSAPADTRQPLPEAVEATAHMLSSTNADLMWHTNLSDSHSISTNHFEVLSDLQGQSFDPLFLLDGNDMGVTIDHIPDMVDHRMSSPSPTCSTLPGSALTPNFARQTRGPSSSTTPSAPSASVVATSSSTMTSSSTSVSTAPSSSRNSDIVLDAAERQRALANESHTTQARSPDTTLSLDHYMRKIADIGLVLMKHLQAIPMVKPGDQAERLLSGPDTKCPIDDVFHLSELFIECLAEILPRLPLTYTESPITTPPPDGLTLDAASELLIFSTYLRLIETYERILHHIHLYCQQRQSPTASTTTTAAASMATATGKEADGAYHIKLPGWTIGNFSLSAKSKTQQLFMIHMTETMLTRLCDLVANLVTRKATYGYRGNWECFGGMSLVIVPDLALQAIRTRERAVLRLVQQIKGALMQ